jgi:hypothetical protein
VRPKSAFATTARSTKSSVTLSPGATVSMVFRAPAFLTTSSTNTRKYIPLPGLASWRRRRRRKRN